MVKARCAICGHEKECVKGAACGLLERNLENIRGYLRDVLPQIKPDANLEEIKLLVRKIEEENLSPEEILDLDICTDCIGAEQFRYTIEILHMELIYDWMRKNRGKIKHLDDKVIDEFRIMVDNDYDATGVSREKVKMLLKTMHRKSKKKLQH